MIDRDRVFTKLDELDGYLRELRSIAPERFEEYLGVAETRFRALPCSACATAR